MRKEELARVVKALSSAYREKEKAVAGESLSKEAVLRIQSLGPLYPKNGYLPLFQRFVWTLSPISCLLVLLLVAVLTQVDFFLDYELTNLITQDQTDFTLLPVDLE
jgi:hypothetical protein